MVPGRWFSSKMSACSASRRTIAWPRSSLRFTTRLRLLRLTMLKARLTVSRGSPQPRVESPAPGRSIFTVSTPISASSIAQYGPARFSVTSTMRSPASGSGAVCSFIACSIAAPFALLLRGVSGPPASMVLPAAAFRPRGNALYWPLPARSSHKAQRRRPDSPDSERNAVTQRQPGMPAGLSEDRLDRIKRVFEDVRLTLGVCWVGELFELLAVYDLYLQAAWLQLKPSVASAYFDRTSREVQTRALRAVIDAGFPVSDHRRLVGPLRESEEPRPVAAA